MGCSFLRGELGAEELRLPLVLVAGRKPALDPDLRGLMVLPVGKQADAVAAGEDLVEVVLEVIERKILVDRLGDLEGWQQVERDAR